MKIKIYLSILIILLISISAISVFWKKPQYIYLDECYRVVEDCVFFDSKKRPLYISYKDCSVPPRKVKVGNIIFVEK